MRSGRASSSRPRGHEHATRRRLAPAAPGRAGRDRDRGAGGRRSTSRCRCLDSSTRGADDTAPRSSSFSTGSTRRRRRTPSCCAGNGHRTGATAAATTTDTALSADDTLVVLDPVGFDRDEERAVRRFVEGGGRLVAGGAGATATARRRCSTTRRRGPRRCPERRSRSAARPRWPASISSVVTVGEGSWAGDRRHRAGAGHGSRVTIATVADRRRWPGRGARRPVAAPEPAARPTADNAAFALAGRGRGTTRSCFAEGSTATATPRGLGAIPGRWKVGADRPRAGCNRRRDRRRRPATRPTRGAGPDLPPPRRALRRRRRRVAGAHTPSGRGARAAAGGDAGRGWRAAPGSVRTRPRTSCGRRRRGWAGGADEIDALFAPTGDDGRRRGRGRVPWHAATGGSTP